MTGLAILNRLLSLFSLLIVAACSSSDRPTAPQTVPEFTISDAVHEGGTPGFFFLPPMVSRPTFSGTFDADIATLKPQVAICDVTNGPDFDCGGSSAGATRAVIVFTSASEPAIRVHHAKYQVKWDTKGAGFVAGHSYRVHVTAGAPGTRRDLGFADVLLQECQGQSVDAGDDDAGDQLTAQCHGRGDGERERTGDGSDGRLSDDHEDGRTLPIRFRIETGIPGSLAVSAATTSVKTGGTDLMTATVRDLHGTLFAGASVVWSVTTTPAAGVADATQPLNPLSGLTGTTATMSTTFKAGTTSGSATIAATTAGLSVSAVVAVGCNCWTAAASMPTGRFGLGVAAVNGILYAVGGAGAATVEAYDPATDTWTTKASIPTPRAFLGVVAVNGILYAVGGFGPNAGALAIVEAYDPASDSWTTKAPMPTARDGVGVAAVNGILYAVGGGTTNGFPLTTLEAYDAGTNTWTTKASMPTARGFLGVAVVNGILYAVGGFGLTTVEAYDPASDTWTTKAPMPTPRWDLGVAAVNGTLYAAGGLTNDLLPPTATLEAYDPASDTWTTKAPMTTARLLLAAGAVNGLLYVVGGFNSGVNGGVLATVETYQP